MSIKKYISRSVEHELQEAAREFPVVVLTGPRQTGKSTTLRQIFADYNYITLDDPLQQRLAKEDPRLFLENVGVTTIIDEIQYAPELLPYLKIAVDRERAQNGQFILTGSQIFPLMSGLSETLAGRAAIYELLGFSLREYTRHVAISRKELFQYILRGFFPEPLVHGVDSNRFYGSYLQSYLERDIRQVSTVQDLSVFQSFLELLAARTASLLNLNEIAKECGISFTTARRWLSLLENSRIVYLLRPYHKNITKRVVKSPKLYFTDTGLLSYILRYTEAGQLMKGPMAGNFFETFVVTEFLKRKMNHNLRYELYFFRDSNHNEIDLVLEYADRTELYEIKTAAGIRLEHGRSLAKLQSLFPAPTAYLLSFQEEQQRIPGNVTCVPWYRIYD